MAIAAQQRLDHNSSSYVLVILFCKLGIFIDFKAENVTRSFGFGS